MTDKILPANMRPVNHAGLMRCCLETLSDSVIPSVVGTIMDCKYEGEGNRNLVVGDDGAWMWNRD